MNTFPPLAASDELSRFMVRGDQPVLVAAEMALANGSGEVLVTDPDRRLIGHATLATIRALIRDGRYLHAKAVDAVSTDGGECLVPQVDDAGKLYGVDIDRSGRFLPVAEPFLGVSEFRNLMDAYLSGWISSQGGYIRQFEAQFAKYCGVDRAVAVSNGTVAIHLALLALGIGPGDEVIVPDLTFAATINTVIMTGATPVIVDVDPETWTMTPETVLGAISTSTRAIIPVHVFGRPAPMTELMSLARKHRLYVIEDCAEAHGASYDNQSVGSFGDISTFSFFANKVITTGEGGMCVTQSPLLAERMQILRDHGMRPERRYWHDQVGYNYRMTNMQAAIGCAQLDKINPILDARARLQLLYSDALGQFAGVQMPPKLPARFGTVTWFACASVPAGSRSQLIEACKARDIDLRPFFNGLSSMPAYARWARPCPVSLRLSREGVNLPTSHYIDKSIVERIASVFKSVLG